MIVDTYFNAEVSSADQFTYKIFQQNALQNMVNTEIKKITCCINKSVRVI